MIKLYVFISKKTEVFMKKYLKALALSCIAVCMMACIAVFATACTDTTKYVITIVTEDNAPVKDLMVQVCDVDEHMCKNPTTDENGKVVIDLTELPEVKEYVVHLLGDYVFADGDEVKTINTNDGYSITFTVKAK